VGKIPTTRALRLISLLSGSNGLVLQVLGPVRLRECGERQHLGLGVIDQAANLRERPAS
jgi:hypothetical protein